jgi:tetratricopeptide (TPR) repeat protein
MKSWNEERWQRLEALFARADELPRHEQASFIEREAADDPEMRHELAAMLAQAGDAPGRIAATIERIVESAASGSEWIGRYFGSYRIVREIGRGGMGIVFEAVRDDEEYQKRVALKVAPDWRQIGALRERFRHERQILAQLEHPNIARFLDGGTEHRVPYFAMEYVEGRPITEYSRDLPLRKRLELFQQVLAAVDYAHGNLIVHRDLKPSNILVTSEGQVKLLDFGVAKLMGPLPGGHAAATGIMMWTPDYASPEQVRGGAITTRTDVYSLGLILYEMLTGRQAQTADTSTPLALDRSVCENELPPADLSNDLDSIVRMAARKEPERRYGSAAALSEDLQRYVEGRPVRARPGTFGYRAGKWIRRHRVSVAAGILIIASIAGGVASTVYQARRAENRFEQVRRLANTFVFDVHDRIENLPGATEARKAIVQTALTYLENLRQDAAGDVSLLRELAGAYERVGDVQGNPIHSNLGDTNGALASYRHAEEILVSPAVQSDRPARRQLASVYFKLAMVSRVRGDDKEAMAKYTQARNAGERLLAEAPLDADTLQLQGEILAEITRVSYDKRDGSAQQSARNLTEIAHRLADLDPSNRNYRDGLSTAHSSLGTALLGAGDLEQAVENYRAAIALREQLVRDDPRNKDYRRNLMVSYGTLGDVLGARTGENLGDMAGAAAALQKALEIAEWLTASDPADRKALFDLVSAQLRMGSLLVEDKSQAEPGLQRLLEAERIIRKLLAEDTANYRYRYNALFLDRRIGDGLAALGRNPDAARRWETAAANAQHLVNGPLSASARLQRVLVNTRLAALHAQSGDSRALELADTVATEIGDPAFLGTGWNQATVYRDLGRIYLKMGRRTDAAAWLEKSLQRWQDMKVPAALESRRQSERAAVEKDLAVVRAKAR